MHLVVAILVAGCAGTETVSEPAPADLVDRLHSEGAGLSPSQRAAHYLDALLAALPPVDAPGLDEASEDARRIDEALRRVGDGRRPLHEALPEDRRFDWRAAAVRLALAAGDLESAARQIDLAPVDEAQRRTAALLTADLSARLGDHTGAARALMALDAAAPTTLVWQHVMATDTGRLERLAAESSGTERGWWRLAYRQHEALTAGQRRRDWLEWRAGNPGHPASLSPPPALAALEAFRRGVDVALLIPLSGEFAATGRAVRDGFTAAYLGAGAGQDDALTIIDTAEVGAAEAYGRAVALGVDVVVGPLRKEAVAAVAAAARGHTVPVVALNTVASIANDRVVQLAYAIEDEAAAIAEALAAQKVGRLAILASPTPWAERAEARLRADLAGKEPQIVGRAEVTGARNMTTVVAEVMHVSASEERHRELSALLGRSLEFTPRRRDDIEAIVTFMDSSAFSALPPSLEFNFAADIPIYAPSTAVRGTATRRLADVRACGMPWRPRRSPVSRALAQSFPGAAGAIGALHALGVDGFRIAHRIVTPPEFALPWPIPGATGMLTLGADSVVRRRLNWIRIRAGRMQAWSPLAPAEPRA